MASPLDILGGLLTVGAQGSRGALEGGFQGEEVRRRRGMEDEQMKMQALDAILKGQQIQRFGQPTYKFQGDRRIMEVPGREPVVTELPPTKHGQAAIDLANQRAELAQQRLEVLREKGVQGTPVQIYRSLLNTDGPGAAQQYLTDLQAVTAAQHTTGTAKEPTSLDALLAKANDPKVDPDERARAQQQANAIIKAREQIAGAGAQQRAGAQVFSRADIEAQLKGQGLTPGTPAFQVAYNNIARVYGLPQGGQLVGAGGLIGASPGDPSTGSPAPVVPLARGETPPVSGTTTQDIRGLGTLQRAAQQVEQALAWPGIEGYLGPYAQYRAGAIAKAPGEALGQVPPAVVDLEQGLARITNFTIKLITGAGLGVQEAERITKELPALSNQPAVFRQRFRTTQSNIAFLVQTTLDLALRGDQKAKALVQELGLLPSGGGGAPGTPGRPAADDPLGIRR